MSACAGQPAPTFFRRSTQIPLGPYLVTLLRVESFSGDVFAGRNSRLSRAGDQVLAVFLRVEGVRSRELARLRFLFMRFKLRDSAGGDYPGVLPVTVAEYQMIPSGSPSGMPMDFDSFGIAAGSGGPPPREWVFLFAVPQRSSGFTLLMGNPTPEPGQAELAAVPLGR